MNSKASHCSKRLVLLDAHAILHRAYHALPELVNSRGEPTGAIYGLSTMLIKIIETLKPDYLIACYDVKGPTYRHEVFKGYKAQRKKAEDDLIAQIIRSRDIFKAMNIPIYDKQGFEADDIIGTIVAKVAEDLDPRFREDDTKKRMDGEEKRGSADRSDDSEDERAATVAGGAAPSSARRSVSYAASPRSTLVAARDGRGANIEIIIASGDMDTMQLIHGDTVKVYTLKKGLNDTIMYDEEAVRERYGFGPELIPDYKGLRGDPSDNIPGIRGIGEKTATILISTFGTIENIYRELEGGHDERFKDIGLTPRIIGLLKDNKEEAEFSKMLATIRRDVPIDFVIPEKELKDDVGVKSVEALWRELEFRTLPQRLEKAIGVLRGNDAKSSHVPDANTASDLSDMAGSASDKSDAVFAEGTIPAPDSAISPNEFKETSIALWLINSNTTNPTIEDIYNFTGINDFAKAKDAIFAELDKRGLRKVYDNIELPLVPVIDRMEKRGIKVNKPFLAELSRKYHSELESIEKKIWQYAGESFNINSPKQLGELLFDKLGLAPKNAKKTAGGARSTKESELEKMRDMHPIVPLIFEFRELSKLLSTYIDAIPPLLDGNDRLHSHFVQAGTTTGRMASQDPNLQNIPVKSELGRAIRRAFVADNGYKLVAFDYSQIELRIAAFLSGDEKMIEIFRSGKDIHSSVAAQVFSVSEDRVDAEMRRRAKVINFGIIYGMGVLALKQNLGTGRDEAQKFLNDYFATFSTLASYLDRVKEETARRGYTETFFGRRRYFEGIKSKIPYIRAQAERMAINAPIQGTEADIIKLAMVKIEQYIFENDMQDEVFPLLQVHDELVYEIREDKVTVAVAAIEGIMKNVMDKNDTAGIELATHVNVGPDWGELK